MFANRFACGSSVAKNNQGQDEIVVQGDFSDELLKMILKNWPNVSLLFSPVFVSLTVSYVFFAIRFLKRISTRLKKRRRKRLRVKSRFWDWYFSKEYTVIIKFG